MFVRKLRFSLILFAVASFVSAFALFRLFKPTNEVFSATTHVVISQIQIAGTATTDDFIELYNPTSSSVDLNGFRLVKRSASGTTDSSIKAFSTTTTIPAFGYFLWANSGWTPEVTPDSTTSASIAADNGIALRQGPEDTGTIIDSVAWGSATNAFVEGSVFPTNPPKDTSIQRKVDDAGGHGTDTDDNSADFEALDVSIPRNSSSITASPTASPTNTPSESPSSSPSPSPIDSSTPTPSTSPTSIASPSVNPSPSSSPIESSSPSSTPSLSPSPTSSPSTNPSVTPSSSPTATPSHSPIPFPSIKPITIDTPFFTCKLSFLVINRVFFKLFLPTIVCTNKDF